MRWAGWLGRAGDPRSNRSEELWPKVSGHGSYTISRPSGLEVFTSIDRFRFDKLSSRGSSCALKGGLALLVEDGSILKAIPTKNLQQSGFR
jgi:hypothetical protein